MVTQDTFMTIAGLQSGVVYKFRVFSGWATGFGLASSPVVDGVLLVSPPRSFRVQSVASTGATLAWLAPESQPVPDSYAVLYADISFTDASSATLSLFSVVKHFGNTVSMQTSRIWPLMPNRTWCVQVCSGSTLDVYD